MLRVTAVRKGSDVWSPSTSFCPSAAFRRQCMRGWLSFYASKRACPPVNMVFRRENLPRGYCECFGYCSVTATLFDSLYCSALLGKRCYYGMHVAVTIFSLLASHLVGRKRYAVVESAYSGVVDVASAVTQGFHTWTHVVFIGYKRY